MAGMTKKDAWLYAASWGSMITGGDPGACLYGFDERFRVQSESHRSDCLAEMECNRADVAADPAGYASDELDQIDSFVGMLKSAKLESEAGALDGLDDFARAYVEALIWTDNATGTATAREFEQEQAEGGAEGNFPASAAAEDIAPATLDRIKADCAAFQAQGADLLAAAYQRPGYDAARAGHDFWLTRNGHGTGFWDRSELEDDSAEYERLTAEMVAAGADSAEWSAALAKRKALPASLGERLSTLAKGFGEVDSYFGDDSQIHL